MKKRVKKKEGNETSGWSKVAHNLPEGKEDNLVGVYYIRNRTEKTVSLFRQFQSDTQRNDEGRGWCWDKEEKNDGEKAIEDRLIISLTFKG